MQAVALTIAALAFTTSVINLVWARRAWQRTRNQIRNKEF